MKVSFHALGFQRQLLKRGRKMRERTLEREGDSKSAQETLQFNNYCAACFKDVCGASIVHRNFYHLEVIKEIN